jgi:hypothetical protein
MTDELLVTTAHRADCAFGPGFYRVSLVGSQPRYCQNQDEVGFVASLVGRNQITRVERDGHCLDGDRHGDANTPDVVDAEHWLSMPREEAMREVGLSSEADYSRVYKQVEEAVSRRNDRQSQVGVRASIVLKRSGRRVVDANADASR